MILAIDPGPEKSGWVYFDPRNGAGRVLLHGHDLNVDIVSMKFRPNDGDISVVIEDFEPWSRQAGHATVLTCKWIGRFYQLLLRWYGPPTLMRRRDVCRILTGDGQCGNAGIREFLFDRFGPGKAKAVGLKKSPGPLYGLRVHEYAALALAIAYIERPPT